VAIAQLPQAGFAARALTSFVDLGAYDFTVAE